MTLDQKVQKQIIDILDSKEFMSDLYEGLDDTTREELGQFYTPASVCIQMIEQYKTEDFTDKTVLDPCCGSGNLLIAMLIAGVDSKNIYGNDYDGRAVELCKKRINRACDILGKDHIRDCQIHQGNALITDCVTMANFNDNYKNTVLSVLLDNDWFNNPIAYSQYKADCAIKGKEVVDKELRDKRANQETKSVINNDFESYGLFGGDDNE